MLISPTLLCTMGRGFKPHPPQQWLPLALALFLRRCSASFVMLHVSLNQWKYDDLDAKFHRDKQMMKVTRSLYPCKLIFFRTLQQVWINDNVCLLYCPYQVIIALRNVPFQRSVKEMSSWRFWQWGFVLEMQSVSLELLISGVRLSATTNTRAENALQKWGGSGFKHTSQ